MNLSADSIDKIVGDADMKIDDVKTYSVAEDADVTNYRWLPAVGCDIVEGQGTPVAKIKATFIAQDSPMMLERQFSDGTKDTLSLDMTFHRYVKSFVDHSIKPGESIEIAGKTYKDADIYYEPVTGDDGYEQVIAHRVTVDLEGAAYRSMTEPYLQTATDNSIWISWKTDFNDTPVVMFGTSEDNLTSQTEGTAQKLSDTYLSLIHI